jgi:hypothetical protein
MARFTTENARAMGQRGGQRTYAKHGPDHMARIGARGFWTTVIRHWEGNPRAFVNYFIAVGLAATDPVPHNGAYSYDRAVLRARALVGIGNRLRRSWRPPALPDDLTTEPPF